MKDVNKVILVGRLGADPIQRHTKTGTLVVHFSVATSRRLFREDSETTTDSTPLEETQWHKIVAWGRLGEICAQYLKKGSTVYLEGFIRSRNYENKEGQSKTSFEVHAENVSFLGGQRPNMPDKLEEAVEVEQVASAL